MSRTPSPWDYLIVTASNDTQAEAYASQLALRRKLGQLSGMGEVMVVADPNGQRVGSGGSTLYCLMQVVNRALAGGAASDEAVARILRGLRILIVHAGGDSRRLPAYGPCGKIFIPVPGESGSALGATLFDRLLPAFQSLPTGVAGGGQVVVASGDALLFLDSSRTTLACEGLTALGSLDTPEHGSKHGVFIADGGGRVLRYLQKPKLAEQTAAGAINAQGQSVLDIGVMSFDASVVLALFRAFEVSRNADGKLDWSAPMRATILARGLDLYREICCALGTEATLQHYVRSARASGSTWDERVLERVYGGLQPLPFHLQIVPQCRFLHFGTTRQLITSGLELVELDGGVPSRSPLSINNELQAGGAIAGPPSWVEACRVSAPLTLAGQNVVIGVDIRQPLALPEGACLDVVPGRNQAKRDVWFVRCYGVGDTFKDTLERGATFCNRPLMAWLAAIGARPEDIWVSSLVADKRSLWDARVFPAVAEHSAYRDWLWMFDVDRATPAQKRAFLAAERYSVAEMARLVTQTAFYERRRASAADVRLPPSGPSSRVALVLTDTTRDW
jgi:fucokinase